MTDKQVLISVIIPFFNRESYVIRIINQLKLQTYHNFEIICVDNNSTDNTLELLHEEAKKDNRIQVFHEVLPGPSQARKFGFLQSSGKYLLFVDSDDFIPYNTIEIFINKLQERPYDLIIGDYLEVTEEDTVLKKMTGWPENMDVLLVKPCLFNKLIKRELVYPEYFIDSKIAEDLVLSIFVRLKSKSIANINEVVYHYEKNPNGLSKIITERSLEYALISLTAVKTAIENEDISKSQRDAIIYVLCSHAIYHALNTSRIQLRHTIVQKYRAFLSALNYKENPYYSQSWHFRLAGLVFQTPFLFAVLCPIIRFVFEQATLNKMIRKLDH
jgi:glycosyltransferase involved in cell wall biosynthesis